MLDFVKGTLVDAEANKIVLETGGIGYAIFIPVSSYTQLPPLGSSLVLYTSLIIREDSHTLFGFLTKEEKKLFETLISISGIGPKTAITILGHLDPAAFYEAIQNNNCNLICKVPGVGKKTAERLVVELKDKNTFKNFAFKENINGGDRVADAIQALITLGYHPIQAQKAIKMVLGEADVADTASLIKRALSKI